MKITVTKARKIKEWYDTIGGEEECTAIREALQAAYATLVENGAYEEAMSGNALDWNEVACYETAVAEIASLINVMPVNDGTAATK